MARTSLHRRSAPEIRPEDTIPVPAGVYHVLVQSGDLRVTRSGTHVISLDLQVVTPREYFGRRLGDVIVPIAGEMGDVIRERVAGYGVPQFIIDDYFGGGLLPSGNEAGLALVAAELTGRTAYVGIKRWTDYVMGRERNAVLFATQEESAAVMT